MKKATELMMIGSSDPLCVDGIFTVSSSGTQVHFLKTNLQFTRDYRGFYFMDNPESMYSTYSSSLPIDMFTGASYDYGINLSYDKTRGNIREDVDWGIILRYDWPNFNYTTLNHNQWNYLLFQRIVNGGTGLGKTHNYGTISSTGGQVVGGIYIYPDDYTTNNYDMSKCAFLPMNGYRDGTTLYRSSYTDGLAYWCSDDYSTTERYCYFYQPNIGAGTERSLIQTEQKEYGLGVRLVKYIN